MPTYEYRCPEGHDFEDFVLKISDAKSELPCPTCGKVAAKRMSAGSGLLFKGSGFYITDYGKDGKKDQRVGAKGSDSASAKSGEASSSSSKSSEGGASSGASASNSSGKASASAGSSSSSKSGGGAASGTGSSSSTSSPKSGPAK
ncbi:MAG: zinc ribbon domain-containing protein [Gemmatimonadaceae bacterium]|nr:zinc ribbon domain-containing protein [Gemmatimonadaceae bacterium]